MSVLTAPRSVVFSRQLVLPFAAGALLPLARGLQSAGTVGLPHENSRGVAKAGGPVVPAMRKPGGT